MTTTILHRHIEALIFCSPSPLSVEEIQRCLSEQFDASLTEAEVQEAVLDLQDRYKSEEYAFEVLKAGGGYQLMTKPAYQESVSVLLKQQSKKRLSKAALETLSIVAYKQPVTKSGLEQIRGVSCDYAIRKLLEKGIIEIKGKADSIGRPVLYGTSEKFLEYFGINDINELPTPKDFKEEEGEIGQEED